MEWSGSRGVEVWDDVGVGVEMMGFGRSEPGRGGWGLRMRGCGGDGEKGGEEGGKKEEKMGEKKEERREEETETEVTYRYSHRNLQLETP